MTVTSVVTAPAWQALTVVVGAALGGYALAWLTVLFLLRRAPHPKRPARPRHSRTQAMPRYTPGSATVPRRQP